MSLLMVACATPFDPHAYLQQQRNDLYLQGNTHNYVDGFADGCASGRKMAGDSRFKFTKNNNREAVDSEYAKGWDEGRNVCRDEVLNTRAASAQEAKNDYYRAKRDHYLNEEGKKIWDDLKK